MVFLSKIFLRDNLEHTTKELLASCQKNLKELSADSSTNKGDMKIQKDRLADELMKLINKLQPIMKSTLQKQRVNSLIPTFSI